MDDAASRAAIFVTATGCCEILKPEHFLAMRDKAICCNIGHFDCEVDVAWLEKNGERTNIKPQVLYCLVECCVCVCVRRYVYAQVCVFACPRIPTFDYPD